MGYGNYVMILHDSNIVTVYVHLASVSVSAGQIVSKGIVLGYMGDTGNSGLPHLHFEVRKYFATPVANALHDTTKCEWLDPTPYIDADLPGTTEAVPTSNTEDLRKNTIPNRFKVVVNGKQTGAYKNFEYVKKNCASGNKVYDNDGIEVYNV